MDVTSRSFDRDSGAVSISAELQQVCCASLSRFELFSQPSFPHQIHSQNSLYHQMVPPTPKAGHSQGEAEERERCSGEVSGVPSDLPHVPTEVEEPELDYPSSVPQ